MDSRRSRRSAAGAVSPPKESPPKDPAEAAPRRGPRNETFLGRMRHWRHCRPLLKVHPTAFFRVFPTRVV